MRAVRLVCGAILLHAVAPAAFIHKSNGRQSQTISLRKRIHVNPLITEPDTIDIEFGAAFAESGTDTFPVTIHYTPRGPSILWGRTEFSLGFDSLNYDGTVRHFGDRATFAATALLHDGAHLDIAVAPQAQFLLRGDSGARYGAAAIARYDSGRHSGGVTVSWTGATSPSATNPAGTFDLGLGYGYAIGKITPHINWLWERSTGVERQISLFEGAEYQVIDPLAIDFSVQHISLWGNARDTQYVIGLTVNTGHLHRH